MPGQLLTLITGAERPLAPMLAVFARVHCQSDEVELIQYPGAEAALAHSASVHLVPPEKQFVIRDILQSKAHDSWRRGSRTCMIIGRVPCNYGERGYEECEHLVRLEREEVNRWNFFLRIGMACCTPSGRIEAIH